MESFESQITSESVEEKLTMFQVRQRAQAALLLEGAPFKGETKEEQAEFDAYAFEWIKNNSSKFREAWSKLESVKSFDILGQWTYSPSLVLEIVKELMKGEKTAEEIIEMLMAGGLAQSQAV